MNPNDEKRLEKMTSDFIRTLLINRLDDRSNYLELSKRLANLIDMEIKWAEKREETQFLMSAWGEQTN